MSLKDKCRCHRRKPWPRLGTGRGPRARGARVTVVARSAVALKLVRARLGVATISADVTDQTAAHRILAEVRPDVLALTPAPLPAWVGWTT